MEAQQNNFKMVVSFRHFCSDLPTFALIYVFLLAIIGAADCAASLDPTTDLVVVVTDGMNPATGLCAGYRKSEENSSNIHHQEFQALLKEMVSLLNAVIKEKMNGSSSLVLLETGCEDGVDVTIEKIIDLMASNQVKGVVTITRGHADRIAEVLQYWNVPVVELVSADVITRESSNHNHFIIPHYAYWQIKHVMLTADVFNWTALTISYQGQSSGTFHAVKDVFTSLASKNGVCILPKHLARDVPTVIFQHDGNVGSTLPGNSNGTVLVVGNPASVYENFDNRHGQSVLHLYAKNSDGKRLMKAINVACNITSVNNSVYSASEHNLESLCANSSGLNTASFGVKSFLEGFLASISFLLSKSEVSMGPLSCNSSNISLECLLSGSSETMLDEKSNVLYLSRNIFVVDYLTNKNSSHQLGFKHSKYDTLSVPDYTPPAVFNKNCGRVCDKCVRCFPSTFTDTNIMTSGQGDSVIVAFFPIHFTTHEGFCGQPNPAGFFASLAFLETIKSHSSVRNISDIQGVVLDSCGSLGEVTSVLHSLETCKFYFKEVVAGINISRSFAQSSIIGYVNGFNSFSLPQGINDKFSLNLHDFGYSTGVDFSQQFINNILAALSKIGWTVINVLVSDHEPFRTFLKLLDASPLSGKFCFVNQIVIHEDATLQEIDLGESLRSMNQTPASLLLTNLEDSSLVLQNIRKHAQHLTTKASLVLTQGNLAVDVNEVLPYVDVIIKLTPVVNNVSQTMLNSLRSTFQSSQSVWSREFINASLASFHNLPELAVAAEAAEALVDSLQASFNAGTSMRDANLGQTSLRVSALYADKNYESEIAFMNTTSSVFAAFSGPSFNVCKGWCPACLACPAKDTAETTNLYLEGDILLTGIFPLHQRGETAFFCGSSNSGVDKILQVQSFMFAVETFKMRYPDLFPGLRIGGLVLDSCSSSATALKVIGNFETCTLNFKGSSLHSSQDKFMNLTETDSKPANPSINVAYILDFPGDSIQSLNDTLQAAQLQNTFFMKNVQSSSQETTSFQFIQATVQTLVNLGWDKIIIMTGNSYEFLQDVNALISEAYRHNICVVATFQIELILLPVRSNFELYQGIPVVLLSTKQDSEIMFDSLKASNGSHIWIIPMYHQSWSRNLGVQDYFPLGSIVIDRKSKENEQYNIFLHNLTTEPGFVGSLSSWFEDLWRLRFSCYFPGDNFQNLDTLQECPLTAPVSDLNISSPELYDTILQVDAVLHTLHDKYLEMCPNGYGVCDQVADAVRNKLLSLGPDVTFDYQGEQVEYTFDGQLATALSVFSYQKDGPEQIGSFFKHTLKLNMTQIRFYTADGSELNKVPRAACVSACQCLTASPVNGTFFVETRPYVYVTTGEFIDDLWVIIALAIAGVGSVLSLIFAIYVVYKVTKKALGKRFVSLGLTLLFSVALLCLSILPFAFTPSEAVCGLRYFLTGVSYASCFAVILVKLMSLQSYKLIGLGGEVSKINQFLTTFFIVGVQIVIGIQWWLNNHPAMFSINDSSGIQKYICNFNRQDFVAYHAYVILLILICCIYAISVRNEKKNMGEARLLLACCCTCVIIWATWLPCLVLLDRKWSDVIICAGILSCATAVLLIIFVPKIRMVSRLKYDLSQKANVRNGHSLDTDFLYERPYSLPGTLTSTFSSAKMNYPKTASSFDADVNY